MTITASERPSKLCWYSKLRSTVIRTSNSAAARRSSSPFLTPAQPSSATVLTSWPGRSLRSARGTHSSSSTRIGNQMGFGLFQRSYRHVAGDGGEVVKKRVQRMAALDVVNQRLDGDARSDKHRGAAQDVRVGVNNGGFFHRLCLRSSRRRAKVADPRRASHFLYIAIRRLRSDRCRHARP